MNCMTTIHKDNTLDTGVQVLGADRARRVEIVLDADVIAHLDRHADTAPVAMKKIHFQTFANSTHTTLATMIDIFVGRAVVKLANRAGVGAQHSTTRRIAARSGPRLDSTTMHAIHEFGGVSIDRVRLVGVVTETADEPATATLGLVLASALIVLASHNII